MSLRSAILAGAIAAALPVVALASSHREAPNITRMPTVDSTDFYLFNSYEAGRSDYVTLIANYIPLQDAYGGPNYFAMDPAALYEIHVDNDGDAVEDLTFQFRFSNRLANNNQGLALNVGTGAQQRTVAVPLKNIGGVSATNSAALNFNESYTLTVVRGDRRRGQASAASNVATGTPTFGKPYDFVGTKTFGSVAGYEAYSRRFVQDVSLPGCSSPGRVFVGQRAEGFAVNLGRVFDLVNLVPVRVTAPRARVTAAASRAASARARPTTRSPTRTSRRSPSKCRSPASRARATASSARGPRPACARRAS